MLQEMGAKVMADTPVRAGYLELLGGASTSYGPFIRGEAGCRPTQTTAVFGFIQASLRETLGGLGFRWNF